MIPGAIHRGMGIVVAAFVWVLCPGLPLQALEPTNGAIYLGEGEGTLFRVYAPNASQVGVVGDFNDWNLNSPAGLTLGANSIWYGTIPNAMPRQKYKYLINDDTEWLRKDPVSLGVENSGESAASIIEDLDAYPWSANEANWQSGAHIPSVAEMVVYELHLKSFLYRNDSVPYQHGKVFDSFARTKLDYLQRLGINAIELMPIHEFPGDTSWGYNPAFWFALESSYGSPEDFQRLVDEAHQRGIAVLVDLCLNHAGPNDITHYWDFDGGSMGSFGGNGNWFYTDDRARTPWGDTEPNWDSGYVRDRLVEAVRMYIADYHCDGVRIDSTVVIRKDSPDGYDWNGTDNAAGWSFLQALNNEVRWRKGGRVVTIAEDIANNQWITRNTNDQGGAGFSAQWSPSPLNNALTPAFDDDRDMNEVARAIGFAQGVNYGLHELVKYHSSHDMVDWRNSHWRLPNRMGDPFQQSVRNRSRLALGTIVLSPGTPMVFMGDEFYAIGQWDDDPDHALDWSQLEADRDFWEFSRAVIRVKRDHPAMHATGFGSFEMPVVDNGRKMVAFKRWDGQGDTLMVVTNWRNNTQSVPVYFGDGEDAVWYEILNSDAARFGGSNEGNGGSVTVSGGWATVNVGPYALIVLSKFPDQYSPAQSWFPWSPKDGERNVNWSPTLEWRWASEASSYDVYVGTDRAAVGVGTKASAEFRGTTTAPEWPLIGLTAFTTYYWRVDPVNTWGTTKGDVWRFTTTTGTSGGEGRAVWDPATPSVGQPLTIHYFPYGNPIDGSTSFVLHWGMNNWQSIVDSSMTATSVDRYSMTIDVPALASQIDFVFRNELNEYDNNSGQDWHVAVSGAPPVVEFMPDPPVAGQPVEISYHADRGTLGGSASIHLHQGFNCWEQVQHVPMTAAGTDTWTYTLQVPAAAGQIDFVFADGPEQSGTQWDNNGGADWHVDVAGAIPAVEWNPNPPLHSQALTITYRDTLRSLEGEAQIYIHRGFNGWNSVVHVPMASAGAHTWTHTLTVPGDVSMIDAAFSNRADGSAPDATWDNNCGADWHIPVANGDFASWGFSTTQINPVSYQGTSPPEWQFEIWNAGAGTLSWTLSKSDAGSGTDWFQLNPESGSSTGPGDKTQVTVTFNSESLDSGPHSAVILVSDTGSVLSPGIIDINMNVLPLHHLEAIPSSVAFDWPSSGTTVRRSINVTNETPGTMYFQVRVVDPASHAWLSVEPTSGSQGGPAAPPAVLVATADVEGLAEGSYEAMLEVSAPNSDNSPLMIPVTLAVPGSYRTGWMLY